MADHEGSAILHDDPRYGEIFDVEKEAASSGHTLIDDPYVDFASMREKHGPVYLGDIEEHFSGKPNPHFTSDRAHYTTLSFEACSKALMDNATYSSLHYHEMPSVMMNIGHTVLTMIGREHARYRSAIQPIMTREQAMGWWRELWIDPFVEILVNDLARGNSADLSLQLCACLPMHTVTAAYGMSSDEALDFRETLLGSMSPALTEAQRLAANAKVRDILTLAIEARRANPRDDLISRLIVAPFNDETGTASRLSNDDIVSFSRLLLLAGGGTTFRQMGILLFALLSNRDQLDDLRTDRGLMQQAIEESLRWNCTDPLFHRLTTKDSVLCGVEIPEGSVIDVCLGAGNRDPERWQDPDRYDLHRPAQRHVGFAAGPHTCLGRFVAAAEMTSAVEAMLDRFPNLRLDDSGEPTRIIGTLQGRGVNHLRVRLD